MVQLAIDSLARSRLLRRVWNAMGRPEECWVAGGFLRDRLLGRHTIDLDLSLPGEAETVGAPARRLAAALGARPHLLGRPPDCVWRVETATITVDLWPLQGLDLEADIARRDFACNALAWRLPSGPLVDEVGGVEDLGRRRLRALARVNLEEDPLRLLRAARFLATLGGFVLEERTAAWIRELAARLADAPRERVGRELELLLAGPAADRGVAAMVDLGLLAPAAPRRARPDPAWLARHRTAAHRLAAPSDHPLAAALRQAGDTARLALLLRAWRIPDADTVAPYSWPRGRRRQAHRAALLLDRAMGAGAAPAPDRRELMWEAGGAFPVLLALAAAVGPRAGRWEAWWRQWRRHRERLLHPPRLLDPREVAALLAIEEGPRLGRALAALTRAQVRGTVRSASGARRWLTHHFRHA